MASPMQLREAVKIIDVDHVDDPDTHARARSIVDAAVEAHEAKCDRLDKGHAHSEPRMDERVGRAFQRLRALERGEEVK